jgi:hypothetical protein
MASRGEETRTDYSNPPNSPISTSHRKVDEEQRSQRSSTPMTPISPTSPLSLKSLSYAAKGQERNSSVMSLDVYDALAGKKVFLRDPARKKAVIPRSTLISETTSGSERGSA